MSEFIGFTEAEKRKLLQSSSKATSFSDTATATAHQQVAHTRRNKRVIASRKSGISRPLNSQDESESTVSTGMIEQRSVGYTASPLKQEVGATKAKESSTSSPIQEKTPLLSISNDPNAEKPSKDPQPGIVTNVKCLESGRMASTESMLKEDAGQSLDGDHKQHSHHVSDMTLLTKEEALALTIEEVERKKREMEEANKKRHTKLIQSIQARQQKAKSEAAKLNQVQRELSALERSLSSDIAILREKVCLILLFLFFFLLVYF